MQLSQIKSTPKPVAEDWGSSDWYGPMKAMKKAVMGGMSIEDAALDQAWSHYEQMGYDDPEDAVPSIIRMYKLRDEKGYIKVDEALLKEGYDERVQAAVRHIVQAIGSDKSTSKEEILRVLHKYAASDPHSDAAEHNRHVIWGQKPGAVMMNGVPDYNASAKTRSEFIKDVLAGLRGKLRMGRQKMSDDERAAKKAEKKKAADDRLWKIYRFAEDKIGQSFPDGDPIDTIGPWMERNKVSMDELNKAFRVHGNSDGYHEYLADMWDGVAGDAVYDAKNGHIDDNSPYYDVDKDGKVTKRDNPWGKGSKPKKAKPAAKQPEDLEESFSFEKWKRR